MIAVPPSNETSNETIMEQYMTVLKRVCKEGDSAQAKSILDQALQATADPAYRFLLLGTYASSTGDDAKAITLYRQALTAGAERIPLTHQKLAYSFMKTENFEDCIAHCLISLELDGAAVDTYFLLGISYLWFRKVEEGIKWLRRILEVNPFAISLRLMLSKLDHDTSDIPVLTDVATGLVFPAQLAGLCAFEKINYEDHRLGYMVNYDDNPLQDPVKAWHSTKCSIYVYDDGVRDIGDGREGKHVSRLFAETRLGILMFCTKSHGDANVRELPKELFCWSSAVSSRFQICAFQLELPQSLPSQLTGGRAKEIALTSISFTLLTGFRSHAIKIRYSASDENQDAAIASLNQLAEGVIAMMEQATG